MTFAIKQNDTSPTLNAALKDADDSVVSLAGATVRFHMLRVGSGTAEVDSAAVVIGDGSAGKVRYNWSASDTASVGTYEGEFEVMVRLKHSQTVVSSPSRLLTIWPNHV